MGFCDGAKWSHPISEGSDEGEIPRGKKVLQMEELKSTNGQCLLAFLEDLRMKQLNCQHTGVSHGRELLHGNAASRLCPPFERWKLCGATLL